MQGNFSTDSLERYQEVLRYLNDPSLEFSEEGETYDFTRCLRPDGSAYGTRGVCQAPNRVAPEQDVSAMNQKDFIAGGGLTAVQKGASSTQVVNRGRDARARAFEGGGGMAAMSKRGLSRDQVVEQGAKNRADAYKSGGGTKSGKSANETIKQGAKNRAEAYKAGGGDAASRGGMKKSDVIKRGSESLKAAYEAGGGKPKAGDKKKVIEQGKKNLKEAFKAGGGEAARAQGLSDKEIIEKGKKALKDAFIAGGGEAARAKTKSTKEVVERGKKALQGAAGAGGGSVRKGQDVLADPMSYTKRSKLEAGGGEAMVKKVSQALVDAYKRALTDNEIENIRARVAGRGVDNLSKYFNAGGGSKAVSKGKTVDEVIDQGQKIIEGARQKAKDQKAREVEAKVNRQSQFV